MSDNELSKSPHQTTDPTPAATPKPKRQLSEAELAARRKGGKVRGEQLKVDKAHQSMAGKKAVAARTPEEKAEQGRKNLTKALEHYPDMRERAGKSIATKHRAEKERKRLAAEQQAREEAERKRLAGEPEPPAPVPKKPRKRGKSKWER